MATKYTAVLSDFKINRSFGRVIDSVERMYKITPSDSPKKELTLSEVMGMIAEEWGLQNNDCDTTRYRYIEERTKEHPRKPQGKMILKSHILCILLGLVAAVFVKLVYFRLYPASSSVELSVCGIAVAVIWISAYFWKFYLKFKAIKKGEHLWLTVIEFYGNQKRYYKNIGSGRANRTNNFENDDMYLHGTVNGKSVHLPVEYGVYRNVCDLKRIPIFLLRDKVYIDEYSVNIERIQWRKKI